MIELSAREWDDFILGHPNAHLLQLGAWGTLKSNFGWSAARVTAGSSGAQILFRRLPLGFSLAYIPKGPVGGGWQALWPQVDELCRRKRSIFLKIEPDAWEEDTINEDLEGFIPSSPIQPRRTINVDLSGNEDAWLERMKQKTRYNIRLAQKKDVVVHEINNVDVFYALMQVTGERDQFGVHSLSYYRQAYELFAAAGNCAILLATYQDKPLASLMVFNHGNRAWYFYGASNDEERNRMPAYLLQWEAMRWAAARGCTQYDLWGIPDADEETLEAEFSSRSDGLWGVYRFKRGFGGQVKRTSGAWDRVYMPAMYRVYRLYARYHGREG